MRYLVRHCGGPHRVPLHDVTNRTTRSTVFYSVSSFSPNSHNGGVRWSSKRLEELAHHLSALWEVALLDLGGDRADAVVADRDPADVGQEVVGPPAVPPVLGLHPEDE